MATLIGRYVGTSRGIFELADGRQVEASGGPMFDSPACPEIGDKVFLVLDRSGEVLRWEPYPGARSRRRDE